MLGTYATGIALLLLVLTLWVAVQNAWRRAFPEALGATESDVLACRGGGCCGGHGRDCGGSSCSRHEPETGPGTKIGSFDDLRTR